MGKYNDETLSEGDNLSGNVDLQLEDISGNDNLIKATTVRNGKLFELNIFVVSEDEFEKLTAEPVNK